MTTTLQKWGNSLAVRLPAAFARQLNWADGSEVEIVPSKDGLMLRPACPSYDLKDLLKKVKPGALHAEADWGADTGNETW